MKKQSSNITRNLLILVAASVSLFATTSASANDQVNVSNIKPVKMTQLSIREHEVGKTIKVRMFIDTQGIPHQIKAVDVDQYDKVLAYSLERQLESWVFNPATDQDGNAQAVWIEVPLHLTHHTS